MSLLLIIRYVLSTENKRRDREQLDKDNSYDDVYIERIGKDGQLERVKVDKVNFIFFISTIFDANN
jgi:ACS family allantoate permease-like MFS transporter